MNKILLIVLLVLNSIVLLGQLWPAGAPPFARLVNIVFLSMSLLYFIATIVKRKSSR
ncbi:MAG TPA: hypothetical protein PLY34_03010 [Ferruginibacter sp.]|nr:hypothetical protein [Ferruginibacter sp.]HPH91410.1 hypothetical protein [Ferruginibacter sp.]